jgi:two-component system, LytTR family, response regulator
VYNKDGFTNMQKTYSCIIVDDDDIDRLNTVSHIKRFSSLTIEGIYTNADEALLAINTSMPDIAFLDIDMPDMTGLELRKRASNIPVCIFITSYADYALDGFDLAALDFIVKPIEAERFEKTIHRINDYLSIKEKAGLLSLKETTDSIFIKEGHQQIKIQLGDILYLEALKDYTSIVTATRKYCIYGALGNIIKEKAFHNFIRIHRSYAVNKDDIEKIGNGELCIKGISLPVGRSYKDALNEYKK